MLHGPIIPFSIRCGVTLAFLSLVLPLRGQPYHGTAHLRTRSEATQNRLLADYGQLPLNFERNQGQTDSQVQFLARGQGYTVFLTSDEVKLAFRKDSAPLRMKLHGANPAAKVSAIDELAAKSNYFIGNGRKKWHTQISTYAKVKYANVYPGIDLIYYGDRRQLEYDFVVAPGANPRRIRFDIRNAKNIHLSADGDLIMTVDQSEVCWHKAVVYQQEKGIRREIAARYTIDSNRIGFEVAEYNSHAPLFIDPVVMVYSTYLGDRYGTGMGVAVDRWGNAYVTGPVRVTDAPNDVDVFVLKLNAAGTALVYSTYLGGSGYDRSDGIAVDGAGSAYITGSTVSADFPTLNPLQPAYAGGSVFGDAFVAKLDPAGSTLVYSTYLGGNADDFGRHIAVDISGNAYVVGSTSSTNFPTMNALRPTFGGGSDDAFVAKLNPAGSAFVYSTYLGGSASENALGIAADTSGNAYIAGWTNSADFPTSNALQPAKHSPTPATSDAFVTKLNATGSALLYSTYLGGSGGDAAAGIAVDSLGSAYVVGDTASTDFPTVNPLQPRLHGEDDLWVAKLNPEGSALVYSTYLGGGGGGEMESGTAIAVDSSGSAYITGESDSRGFPTVDPMQPALGGGRDAVVAKIDASGSALVYSTYLGGSGDEYGYSIAVDDSGSAYVTGETDSSDFPTMHPLQSTNHGVFLTKISSTGTTDTTPPVITPRIDGTPGTNGWYRSAVTVSWTVGDPESGIASSNGCGPTTLANDTTGTTLTCSAIDGAGLSGSASVTIKLDKTPPVISCAANPKTLWPPSEKSVAVTISGGAVDATSGVDTASATYHVGDEYGKVQPEGSVALGVGGRYSSAIPVIAARNGDDKNGRTYTIVVTAKDRAGNAGSCSAVVTVPHDQGAM